MRREKQFRLDLRGRPLGCFRGVELAKDEVVLVGWAWLPGAGAPARGANQLSIVLTGPGGEELRRWSCGGVEWEEGRVVVSRIRRLG